MFNGVIFQEELFNYCNRPKRSIVEVRAFEPRMSSATSSSLGLAFSSGITSIRVLMMERRPDDDDEDDNDKDGVIRAPFIF